MQIQGFNRAILNAQIQARRSIFHMTHKELFSEESQKKILDNFRKTPKIRLNSIKDIKKHAAVLIPLCVVDGDVSLLYTKRSTKLRSHSGQVSFPGE